MTGKRSYPRNSYAADRVSARGLRCAEGLALILDLADRFAHHRQTEIDALDLAEPLDLKELNEQWRTAVEAGRELVRSLPGREVGCLYLDGSNHVIEPDPQSTAFGGLQRHFGSVGGAWPRIVETD